MSDPEAGCGLALFLPRFWGLTITTFLGELGDEGGENAGCLLRGLRIVDGGVEALFLSGLGLKPRGEGVVFDCAATLLERRGE